MMLKILRHALRQEKRIKLINRSASTYQYLNINTENNEYSIIELRKPPVNSLNLHFMKELIDAIDSIENDGKSRGLVITSSLKSFGAGLDLVEMCNSNAEHLYSFWTSFQEVNLRLYMSPLVTIAAINGHAVAGASALTLSCDYRIMADGKYKIGLPTVHTGILVPLWLARLFKLTVGSKEAERYLCLGRLSSPSEALANGLVDKIVANDELLTSVSSEMDKWLSVPDFGRVKTKQLMRRHFVDEFHVDRNRDRDEFLTMMDDPAFVKHLKSYTGKLKRR